MPDEPLSGLIQAVNQGGDTDSICAMMGSLYGARNGLDWIPTQFVQVLDKDSTVKEAITALRKLA